MGKDPLTKDIFGWLGGGKKQASTVEMFGGPSGSDLSGALTGQQENVGTAQNIWNTLFKTVTDQFNATAGPRNAVIKRANDILSGNYDPAASPAYSPMKRSVEGQYGKARENIMASLPSGGTMADALTKTELSKAGSLSDIMSQILTGELNQAYNVGNQSYPQAVSGLSSALQGGAIPGQMMSSILDYLVKRLSASAANQEAVNIF